MNAKQRAAQLRRGQKQALNALKMIDKDGLSEIEKVYKAALLELNNRILEISKGGQVEPLDLSKIMTRLNSVLESIRTVQRDVFVSSIQQAADIGVNPAVLSGSLKTEAAAVSTGAVRAVWEQKQADGLALSDRLWRVEQGASRAISRELASVVARGDNAMSAARAYLSRGESVPGSIAAEMKLSSVTHLQKITTQQLLTGEGSALSNMQRVFRTEVGRAHTVAYINSVDDDPDVVGYQFNLGASHRKQDICDMHASVNLHGLGAGVYPKDAINRIYPAHPNTFSYITAVFAEEIKPEDKKKDKNRVAWLAKQSEALQVGVLGKGKAGYLQQGKLTDRSINTPLRVLKKRLG